MFYICKYLELIFLIAVSIILIVEGISLMRILAKKTLNDDNADNSLFGLLPVCMVFAAFNVFHNNLCVNLRFKCKTCCKSIGILCFDVFNFLTCFCWIKKVCQDRCFTIPTIIKWCVTIGLFGYTIFAVNKAQKDVLGDKENYVVRFRTDDGDE